MVYAGYWYGKESANLKSQISKPQLKTENLTPTEIPALTSTPTPDPTADWKTYIEKDRFSFKYPPDWLLEVSSLYENGIVRLAFFENGEKNYFIINKYGRGTPYVEEIEQQKIIVGGRGFIKETFFDNETGQPFLITLMPAQKDFDLFWFSYLEMNVPTTGNIEKYNHIFDQILSTFKFSE